MIHGITCYYNQILALSENGVLLYDIKYVENLSTADEIYVTHDLEYIANGIDQVMLVTMVLKK